MRTDYKPTDTIYHFFSTIDGNQAPVAPVGGALRVYVDGSLTELTSGAGLTVSFDGVVGWNLATISLATMAIPPGSQCCLVFTGTVDGVSVIYPLEHFTVLAQGAEIAARGTLSAVTDDGGTLSSVGTAKAGDFVRMVSGTSKGYRQIDALNTGTGVFTFRTGTTWTTNPTIGDYYEVISAPQLELLGAADIADDALTAAKLAADAVTAIQSGLATAAALATVDGIVDAMVLNDVALASAIAAVEVDTQDLQSRLPAALVGGKMDVSVSAMDVLVSAAIADAYLDRTDGVETGLTPRQALRLQSAILLGLTNGLSSSISGFKSVDVAGGAVQGTKTRITGTRNTDGDRTAVAVDLT